MVARFLLPMLMVLTLVGGAQAAAVYRCCGGDIQLIQPFDDDLLAAGHRVSVAGPVAGDTAVAGFDLGLSAPIGGDLLAIGYDVSLLSTIGGDATVAAIDLFVGPEARIGGDLLASAADARIDGAIQGDVQLAGRHVVVSGSIAGSLDVVADTLELLPGTRILGDLRFAGPDPVRKGDDVTIKGTIRHHYQEPESTGASIAGTAGRALALFLLGLAVLWLFPGAVRRASTWHRRTWVRHTLLGGTLLLALPLLMAALAFSVIGIPLALLLGGAYLLALPVGLAVAAMGFTLTLGGIERQRGTRILRRFAGAALGLTLLALVPWVGPVLLLLISAYGLGALIEQVVYRRDRPLVDGKDRII